MTAHCCVACVGQRSLNAEFGVGGRSGIGEGSREVLEDFGVELGGRNKGGKRGGEVMARGDGGKEPKNGGRGGETGDGLDKDDTDTGNTSVTSSCEVVEKGSASQKK